jgi:hypothetical protein
VFTYSAPVEQTQFHCMGVEHERNGCLFRVTEQTKAKVEGLGLGLGGQKHTLILKSLSELLGKHIKAMSKRNTDNVSVRHTDSSKTALSNCDVAPPMTPTDGTFENFWETKPH